MLCAKGDVTIRWNPKNPDEVKTAEEMFLSLKSKGHMFFKISKAGVFRRKEKRGERVRAFAEAKGAMIAVFEPKEPLKGEVVGRIGHKKRDADGELIKDFDPEADKIVATPPIGGG
jgi:hypothetical protein